MGLVEWVPDFWQWINSNGGGLAGISAVVAAVVAVWALRHTALDSRERTRPVMVGEFRKAENSAGAIDLVVRNIGASVARHVEVDFDPKISLPEDTSQLVTPFLLRRYAEPIAVVAPGQELSNIWFSTDYQGEKDGRGDLPNHEPTPNIVTVTIRYRDADDKRTYCDAYRLDVDVVRMTTYSTASDSIPGRIDGIHKSLAALIEPAKEIAKTARYIRRDEVAEQAERHKSQVAALRERMIRDSDQT